MIHDLREQHSEHIIVFFFNDPATTEIYTLSLHDALPISTRMVERRAPHDGDQGGGLGEPERARRFVEIMAAGSADAARSEEHTSELQSRPHLVCRLLLEKKKK